jgi:O-antigen ligase
MPANDPMLTAYAWLIYAVFVLVPVYLLLAYRAWPSRALRFVLLGAAILIVRSIAAFFVPEYVLDTSQGRPEGAILVPNAVHAVLGILELAGNLITIAGVIALWRTKPANPEAHVAPVAGP